MKNIVYLKDVKESKMSSEKEKELEYQAKILGMDKSELLVEMAEFQYRGSLNSLTEQAIKQGIYLFKVLKQKAETPELKHICSVYLRDLINL